MKVRASIVALVVVVAGCAATPGNSRDSANTAAVPMEIRKPDGAGPFPAVVILHDCSGLGPRSSGSPRRWANELVKRGYVVAIPDSFSTRGHPNGVCTESPASRGDVAPLRRVGDAYEALDRLRELSFVDGAHVGVMGGSHGGMTTLAAMLRESQGFAAAVALYPPCRLGNGPSAYRPSGPVLILAGELDDWTPASQCIALAQEAQKAGEPVRIKVYPGTHHSFDNDRPVRYVAERTNANAPGGKGATTGGNPAAWADSIREVSEFFAAHLRR